MSRILLHVCCAPCGIAPLRDLRDRGFDVTAFWYNPNIHPYSEYSRRLETVRSYLDSETVPLIEKDDYDLVEHLRRSAFREADRCIYCYDMRLRQTAVYARKGKFDVFSTTLLFSSYMDRESVIRAGKAVATEIGIGFFEADWRHLFRESVDVSREKEIYRQNYCGCIYSEAERFAGLDLGRVAVGSGVKKKTGKAKKNRGGKP
ncbi:epoxyqueuosine reductase QueH [candidate division KSB1 bacterium]